MHEWQRSRRELQRFREGFPDAVVVPGHDPAVWEELEARYE
jgi:glyoxylase-like metal-dependent hydrolase (beta-lactamase superfamily II)